MGILDQYISTIPSDQNIVDLFQDEWASKFPDHTKINTKPGFAGLFEDPRIHWLLNELGSVEGKNILELGPLEAGHTYMLHEAGANVTAVEMNSRAFLKCLCAKEIFGLTRTKFLLGDFIPFMEQSQEKYDTCVASGVMYHMFDPLKFIKLLARVSEKVFIWTHYYDERIIDDIGLKGKFSGKETITEGKENYELNIYEYQDALNWKGFCGGSRPQAKWMTKEGIISALKANGFCQIEEAFNDVKHPNGPCFVVFAQK